MFEGNHIRVHFSERNTYYRLQGSIESDNQDICCYLYHKRFVLQQIDHAAYRANPCGNSYIYEDQSPRVLGIGKKIRQFAKSDCRAHKRHKTEGVKEVHLPGIALIIDAGNYGQPSRC